MDRQTFVASFGHVFEHSPWVAEAAFDALPADSWQDLHAKMAAVVKGAGEARQLELLNAHPELAGREARDNTLTDDSTKEQESAGLGALSAEEMTRIAAFNRAYAEKFGFPFIIAARHHTKDSILAAMETRLANDAAAEIGETLAQVFAITRMRLEQIFAADSTDGAA